MVDYLHRIFDKAVSPAVAVCVVVIGFATVATMIAVWHSYEVCIERVAERKAHLDWIEHWAESRTEKMVEAMQASTLATQSQLELVRTMRTEMDERETRIEGLAHQISMAADAVRSEAREVRKAALTFIRWIEQNVPTDDAG